MNYLDDKPTWMVILQTQDLNGVPYPNIYRHVFQETAEEAIDYALEKLVGMSGGQRHLLDGWRVTGAFAMPEDQITEARIEPIDQPLYKRVLSDASS